MSKNNQKKATGENGIVTTARQEATEIGINIIKSGGNAIDAAVAVGFALGVCEPNASGIGGGGFMTLRLAESNRTVFIDFREIAPLSAMPSMWKLDADGKVLDNNKSQGGKSICIPGEVEGLLHALEKYGTMSLADILEPAIRLAEDGFKISRILANDLTGCNNKLSRYEEEGNPFTGGEIEGDILKNIPLSNTLKAIKEQGRKGFYEGPVAAQIVESVNRHGGNWCLDDLKNYQVNEYEPIIGTYRGYKILSSPPPSSGGTHIVQILNILEKFNLSSLEVNSDEYIHILSETFKMSFSDRLSYMGDPKFSDVPIKGLTSKAYGDKLSKKIIMNQVMPAECDVPFDFEPKDTTHYSIGDKDGNMVSVTKTISAFFGSGVVPKNTGVVLNCQMRGFAIGAGKANSVGPHKKPLSSMSPTLILKEGKPFAILGSPGGNRIIPIVAQVISKLIDHEMSIFEAVDSPRVSNDVNEILFMESRINSETIESLKALGHHVEVLNDYDRKLGGVQAIRYTNKCIEGAADSRRDGVAIGY